MKNNLDDVLSAIEDEYEDKIQRGARHYLEVGLAEKARNMGFKDLAECFRTASAIVPLRTPQDGMKVRIDGRTFVNYAEYDSGIAIPGYLAKSSAKNSRTFIPQDSMICNFC
jgi:hypothetical protein